MKNLVILYLIASPGSVEGYSLSGQNKDVSLRL